MIIYKSNDLYLKNSKLTNEPPNSNWGRGGVRSGGRGESVCEIGKEEKERIRDIKYKFFLDGLK